MDLYFDIVKQNLFTPMLMATVYTDDNFASDVLSADVALIDFFAAWCGPCQSIAPIIDEVAEEFKGKAVVGKIDVDASPEIAQKYGVMSIPTIIAFRKGEISDKVVGAVDKDRLVEMITE